MKTSIHSRINYRANQVNKARCFGQKMENVFYFSFDLGGNPKHADLTRYEFAPDYNLHIGYYN